MRTLVKVFVGIVVLAGLLGLAVHAYSSKAQTPHEKQLAYVKKHQQEIIDFVKSQNAKVESVQIDWSQTKWDEPNMFQKYGNLLVFGRVNNIENSSWRVDVPISDDNTADLKDIYMGFYVEVGGEALE